MDGKLIFNDKTSFIDGCLIDAPLYVFCIDIRLLSIHQYKYLLSNLSLSLEVAILLSAVTKKPLQYLIFATPPQGIATISP